MSLAVAQRCDMEVDEQFEAIVSLHGLDFASLKRAGVTSRSALAALAGNPHAERTLAVACGGKIGHMVILRRLVRQAATWSLQGWGDFTGARGPDTNAEVLVIDASESGRAEVSGRTTLSRVLDEVSTAPVQPLSATECSGTQVTTARAAQCTRGSVTSSHPGVRLGSVHSASSETVAESHSSCSSTCPEIRDRPETTASKILDQEPQGKKAADAVQCPQPPAHRPFSPTNHHQRQRPVLVGTLAAFVSAQRAHHGAARTHCTNHAQLDSDCLRPPGMGHASSPRIRRCIHSFSKGAAPHDYLRRRVMEKHEQLDGPGGADSHEQLELLKKVYDASPRSFSSSDGDGGGSGCCRSGESKWLFGRGNPVPAEARMLLPPMTRTHRQLGTLRNPSTPHAAIPDQRVIIHESRHLPSLAGILEEDDWAEADWRTRGPLDLRVDVKAYNVARRFVEKRSGGGGRAGFRRLGESLMPAAGKIEDIPGMSRMRTPRCHDTVKLDNLQSSHAHTSPTQHTPSEKAVEPYQTVQSVKNAAGARAGRRSLVL